MLYGKKLDTEVETANKVRFMLSIEIQILLAVKQSLVLDSRRNLQEILDIDIYGDSTWEENFDKIFCFLLSNPEKYMLFQQSIHNQRSDDLFQQNKSELVIFRAIRDLLSFRLNLDNILTILRSIQVVANPVSMEDSKILNLSYKLLKLVWKYSGEMFPFLADALYRHYMEIPDLYAMNRLREVISRERKDEEVQHFRGSIFYAFGHQYKFLDIIHKLYLSFPEFKYHFYTDFDLSANSALMALQKEAGIQIDHKSSLTISPAQARSWNFLVSLRIPGQESIGEFANRLNDDYVIDNEAIDKFCFNEDELESLANSFYFFKDNKRSPIISKPDKPIFQSQSIKKMLDITDKFILVQWRSNTYKQESTNFNQHRNSNESEVLKALLEFSVKYQVHIYIACDIDQRFLSLIAGNKFLHYEKDFSAVSCEEYIYLLSRCFFFFSGPSGAMSSASVLFHRPTLVFDHPPFFNLAYHPFSWYVSSDLYKNNESLSLPRDFLIHKYPQNSLSLRKSKIWIKTLAKSELFSSLEIFYLSLLRSSPENIPCFDFDPSRVDLAIHLLSNELKPEKRILKGKSIFMRKPDF